MSEPRSAATTILLRRNQQQSASANEFEVLLLERSSGLAFAAGFWVFPGGAIDEADFVGDCTSVTANEAQMRQAVHQVAIRETWEECNIQVAPSTFTHYSNWTTPAIQKKRFATWFILAEAPTQHDVIVDGSEIVAHRWLSPERALGLVEAGEIKMMPPTFVSLFELNQCQSIEEVYSFAKNREVPNYLPKPFKMTNGVATVYQEDAAYQSDDIDAAGGRHRVTIIGNTMTYVQQY